MYRHSIMLYLPTLGGLFLPGEKVNSYSMFIEKRLPKKEEPYWKLCYEKGPCSVPVYIASSFADAALIARYLDGATLPDAECIRAQEILKEGDGK